jgi:hypothetical protein
MTVRNEPTSDELLATLKKFVEKEQRSERDRHAKAGHPI